MVTVLPGFCNHGRSTHICRLLLIGCLSLHLIHQWGSLFITKNPLSWLGLVPTLDYQLNIVSGPTIELAGSGTHIGLPVEHSLLSPTIELGHNHIEIIELF